MTSLDPGSHGNTNTTADTGDSSPAVTGLLGYKIELGRFTEDVIRKCRNIIDVHVHVHVYT